MSTLRRAMQQPPHVLVAKARARIGARAAAEMRRRSDRVRATLLTEPAAPLSHFLHCPDRTAVESQRALPDVAAHYLDHRFDLLGSGWRTLDRTGPVLVNRANAPRVDRLRLLLSPDYRPIDWQLDIKSGFRWDERTWFRDITYGDRRGADVKVPWELARGQHLPQLALAHTAGLPIADDCRREFRDQVIDFITANPPGWGVNWARTMDVAIRVANWLVGWDLFHAGGAEFDADFEHVFRGSVGEHASFIARTLEWSPSLRSNHYLADIAGLLVAAAYLPSSPRSDAWLRFATHELVNETVEQFLQDGSNFEASTSYHRLSAEMVVWATAYALAVPTDRLRTTRTDPRALPRRFRGHVREASIPSSHLDRVESMAEFTLAITKPSGAVPQIGDNDSGRFLKLSPAWRRLSVADTVAAYANLDGYEGLDPDAAYWFEDDLDHSHLLASVGALVGRQDLVRTAGEVHQVEAALVASLRRPRDVSRADAPVRGGRAPVVSSTATHADGRGQCRIRVVPGESGLSEQLRELSFPDFGLYVWKSPRLYMAIRCGPVGQRGNGGHAHNDQLSFDLMVDGTDWWRDPGTGVYTPWPDIRNRYRSALAHSGPRRPDREPGPLHEGLFRLPDTAHARCLRFGDGVFVGEHDGYGAVTRRTITLRDDSIEIVDEVPSAATSSHLATAPEDLARLFPAPPFSPRYGWLSRS